MSDVQRTIPCSEAVRALWDYLDQAIAPEDQKRVEQHLAFCRRCCGEMEFATELRGFLASQQREEIPAEVRARLQRFVDEL